MSGSGARLGENRQRHVACAQLSGRRLADRNQSIPVHFSDRRAMPSGLRAGQFVTVLRRNRTRSDRASRCRARAVVRAANGQDFVFEHTSAERFEPRPVRIEPLDGERVLIVGRLEAGKRVVVQGAELLDHVR